MNLRRPKAGTIRARIHALALAGRSALEIAGEIERSVDYVHASIGTLREQGYLPRMVRITGYHASPHRPALDTMAAALREVEGAISAVQVACMNLMALAATFAAMPNADADPDAPVTVPAVPPPNDDAGQASSARAKVPATGQSRLGAAPPVPATAPAIAQWAAQNRCSFKSPSDLRRVNAVRLQVGQPPFAIVDVPPGPAA